MTPIEIRQRYERLRAQRRTIETTWDIIERFAAPYRGEMFREQQSEHEQDWRRREVYDTTGIMAVQNLAAAIHGGITNPSTRWFDLRFRNKQLNEDHEARVWLEGVTDATYQALVESDFDLEVNEAYVDLTSFGTAIIIEEPVNDENWEGLDFTATPIKDCFFETNHKNQVHRFYRKLLWTPVQICEKFGDNCPDDIKEKANTAAGIDQKEELIFCIYPRPGYKDIDVSKPLIKSKRPFGMKYVRHKDASMIGEEGGYYEMPAFIPRWRKTSESMWGNSPAMIALADILTLNQLVELDLRSREKVVDPPALIEERGALGDLDLEAGGLTVMRDIEKIKPYESGARFDAVNDTMKRLQDQIKEIFFLDKLDLKESPQMTATEVIERSERMHRLLGPTVGRIQTDMLSPLVERTYNIMLRAGQLPEMPDVVKQSGGDMDIEYVGSLSRAMKIEKIASLEKFLGTIAQFAAIKEDILDIVDWDKAARAYADFNNVSTDILIPQAQLDEMREARAQQQQQMQMAQMAQEAGAGMTAMGEGAEAMQNNPELTSIEGGQGA